jgi:hypothetical protein
LPSSQAIFANWRFAAKPVDAVIQVPMFSAIAALILAESVYGSRRPCSSSMQVSSSMLLAVSMGMHLQSSGRDARRSRVVLRFVV